MMDQTEKDLLPPWGSIQKQMVKISDKDINSAFHDMAENFRVEAALLYAYEPLIYNKLFNGQDFSEIQTVTDDMIKNSDQNFFNSSHSEYESLLAEFEVNGFYFEDPEVMRASNLFELFLDNERDPVDIDNLFSFSILADDAKAFSILLKNFSPICDYLSIYQCNFFKEVLSLREAIVNDIAALTTRWSSGSQKSIYSRRMPQGIHGGMATRGKMEKRLNNVKKDVFKHYTPDTTTGLMEIKKTTWDNILAKHNDGTPMSFPTSKKYRDRIEKQLSEKYQLKVKIKLKN